MRQNDEKPQKLQKFVFDHKNPRNIRFSPDLWQKFLGMNNKLGIKTILEGIAWVAPAPIPIFERLPHPGEGGGYFFSNERKKWEKQLSRSHFRVMYSV